MVDERLKRVKSETRPKDVPETVGPPGLETTFPVAPIRVHRQVAAPRDAPGLAPQVVAVVGVTTGRRRRVGVWPARQGPAPPDVGVVEGAVRPVPRQVDVEVAGRVRPAKGRG